MTSNFRRVANRIWGLAGLSATALILATALAGPARADVKVRVEARPISDPIQAFVTVTNGAGAPVEGLTAADFAVTLDGIPVAVNGGNLTLPPAEDANQKVSVVFAMDYSVSVTRCRARRHGAGCHRFREQHGGWRPGRDHQVQRHEPGARVSRPTVHDNRSWR